MEDNEEIRQELLALMEKLEAKIAFHEQQAIDLRRMKDEFLRPGTAVDATKWLLGYMNEGSTLLDKQIHEAETVPLSVTAETSYGDMASTMRRYIVQGIDRLRTRKEIVDAAKEMDASSNFPYRFLKRMLDTGELVEVSRGQYAATPKMVKKVEGI